MESMTDDPINLIYEIISKYFIGAKYKHNISSEEPKVQQLQRKGLSALQDQNSTRTKLPEYRLLA